MRLGIDFGTTRTVVAAVDRGNYPIVAFEDQHQDAVDYLPTVALATPEGLRFGFAALAAAESQGGLIRSFKRYLATPEVSFHTAVPVAGREVPIFELLHGFAQELHTALRSRSNLAALLRDQPLEAVIGVPAHSPTAQRMLTLEAFRRAGFEVLGMMNEPSAAGFEYTHRYPRTINSRRTDIVVYDLGGGTFDASLVRVEGRRHRILHSVGEPRLGGDDFDAVLAGQALQSSGGEGLPLTHWPRLLDEARSAKEQIAPQTRRVTFDVDGAPVSVPIDEFYQAAAPLVERTLAVLSPLLELSGPAPTSEGELAGIYLVGGASGLPLVPRVLRERFGRRVHRSPHPSASTAIGLAIAADPDSGYTLFDRLTRGIGVFRERDSGEAIAFDLVVPGTTELPAAGDTLVVTRSYRAAHDIGRFRFVEVAGVDDLGEPRGDIAPFAEVVFPFDPELRDGRDLAALQPRRITDGPSVEERYSIDANRVVRIRITDLDTGYAEEHAIG